MERRKEEGQKMSFKLQSIVKRNQHHSKMKLEKVRRAHEDVTFEVCSERKKMSHLCQELGGNYRNREASVKIRLVSKPKP